MNTLLAKFKDALGQIEVLKTYYDRLSDRERYIVTFGFMGAVFALFMIVYLVLAGINSSMRSSIKKNQNILSQLNDLKTTYLKAQKNVESLEQIIRRTNPNFQLATEIEKIANKYSISIGTFKDRQGQPNDLYTEKQTTVTLESVDLKTLIHFLHEIENNSNLMRISSLQIKPNFKDPSMLNVNFVVSTFQLKEGQS